MKKPEYSLDLKERVIAYIKSGNNQKTASKIFKVSTSSVNRWWLSYKKENKIVSKPRLGSKGKINPQELKSYVEANANKTLSEISKQFKVSACAIHKRLKKLGYSYKKKPSPMWKLAKKSEKSTKKK